MIRSQSHARSDLTLLGAPAGADEAAIRRAFLAAVKAARPDQGGDPERYREIIAAYRRLTPAAAAEDLDFRLELRISAELARAGGHKLVTLPDGRRLRVRIPSGVAQGRVLRLARQGMSAPGRWGDVCLTVVLVDPARIRVVPEAPPELQPSTRHKLRRFQDSWAA
ncbi:MAG: hypothetical protein M3M95_00925 [Pseudomonadota bacterium]|nr:hypothetical protein [Pseudomonadota bacterium]